MDETGPVTCVTGATGMVGRALVARLLEEGHAVRALSRRPQAGAGRLTWHRGDLTEPSSLPAFLAGAGGVFHCAGELRDPSRMRAVNLQGTANLLDAAGKAGVGLFCHVSSAGVIGATGRKWVDEDAPCRPRNIYETTKYEAERRVLADHGGFGKLVLRPTNVVDDVRPGAMGLALGGSFRDRLVVAVKGGECAHVVHAVDVAAAAVYLAARPLSPAAVFFVSCDHDPMNTFAGLWALVTAVKQGKDASVARPAPHLPLWVPYWMRRVFRAGGNRGDVRYSPARLLATGFVFRLGIYGAAVRIVNRWRQGAR